LDDFEGAAFEFEFKKHRDFSGKWKNPLVMHCHIQTGIFGKKITGWDYVDKLEMQVDELRELIAQDKSDRVIAGILGMSRSKVQRLRKRLKLVRPTTIG